MPFEPVPRSPSMKPAMQSKDVFDSVVARGIGADEDVMFPSASRDEDIMYPDASRDGDITYPDAYDDE
ncbi:hypothetical protein MMC26_005169 [Xylographa opegraphella]|nr:hypothetical protein [Xylographa opegraphella]